jgi:hypothetical protein
VLIVRRSERLPVIPKPHRPYRDPGCHVSAIIKSLCVALDPERFGSGKTERQQATDGRDEFYSDLEEHPKIWLGQAVDHYLTECRGKQSADHLIFRPKPVERDGVWASTDLVVLADEPPRPGLPGDTDVDLIVEEFKLTWMTAYTDIEDAKFIHWMWQIKWYCWVYETVRARLRVYFVNGDWRPPSPDYRVWDLLFTYRELENNAAMLLGHGRKTGLIA